MCIRLEDNDSSLVVTLAAEDLGGAMLLRTNVFGLHDKLHDLQVKQFVLTTRDRGLQDHVSHKIQCLESRSNGAILQTLSPVAS